MSDVNWGSDANIKKVVRVFMDIAKEPFTVEYIGGNYYAFCSELAALRLWHGYTKNGNSNGKFRVSFSENKDSWYFSMQVA